MHKPNSYIDQIFPSVIPTRSHLLQRKCACGGTPGPTGECEACRKKREATRLQRTASHAGVVPDVPPVVHEVLQAPGQPLDTTTRAFMEPRFGHDFSSVRVHSDTRAAESARAVNALAYTVGSDIVFGGGKAPSGDPSGQYVLAHELAHVVQQSGHSASSSLRVAPTTDPAEAAADVAAHNILSSNQPLPPYKAERQIQRLGANPGCTPAQAAAIHQSIFNANSWAKKALTALSASPLDARTLSALRHNFGSAGTAGNAATIAARLRAGRDDMLKNPYSCTNASGDTFCANGNCGDTVFGSHASNVCTNVTLATGDAMFRAGCVLHEAMHASDTTMTADDYSGWFGHSSSTPGYPGASPLTNPDSYTTLAMELS